MPIKITSIPILGSLYQWWNNRAERKELDAAAQAFARQMQKPDRAAVLPLTQKVVTLIDRSKDNPALKKETARLERTYFTFLKNTGKPLPAAYLACENKEISAQCEKMGISSEFLTTHPEFLSVAKDRYWVHYFPFVSFPLRMIGKELFLPFELNENSGIFFLKPWSDVQKLDLAEYRITYQGFAVGHPDHSKHLVPLKTVDADGKYALQFVTSCPRGRRLPSSIDFKESGHSFTQIIIPKNGAKEAEVFSVGFYPRKVADFGYQYFKTVPGIYRNHDSNVSRIQAGQVIPIVKQYLLLDDKARNPCILSMLRNMEAITAALKAKGLECPLITEERVEKACLERNEPELDRILIELTQIRRRIAAGEIDVDIKPMTRVEKAQLMKGRFEKAQGKHAYNMLGANCTAASYREEAFAVAFLDAALDKGRAVKLYDSQIDLRDHQFGFLDRVRNILERVCLHFFAALPLTGPFLGTGFTHPDSPDADGKSFVPTIFSDAAAATHALLIAPFVQRPLFPAGELLAHDAPVIQPPGIFARIKYLIRRHLLLKTN